MIETYQEKCALNGEQKEPAAASFAYIGTVHSDGVTLVWEADGQESVKHYKVNRSVVFKAGDYVRVIAVSGTYIAEYPVGAPIFELIADRASTAAFADKAASAETAGSAKTAETAAQAETAATAQCAQEIVSKDDGDDRIRLTFNSSKSTFAILSKKYTKVWRDFAQN